MPQADLATAQVRHFYHLEAAAPTDPSWQWRADHGHIFRFEWLPLDPPPALIPPQDGWLRHLPAGPGPAQVIIEQGDLALRKLQPHPTDYAALQRWLSDPRVLEFYAGRDQAFDLARVSAQFDPAAAAAAGETPCLIFYKGWAAGFLQFYPLASQAACADYGLTAAGSLSAAGDLTAASGNPWALDLFIGQPELWSRGLGTKLLNAFADWLFSNTPATALAVDPHADNLRAIRAYEKAGFRRHKLLPAHKLHEGKWVDCVVLVKSAFGN
ncbi:GNAT family N-acetyltransferase [Longilinea arvoryzae]|uniref:GNAT family N-acetyltransferase n=1 Tax=Longilinea arvoryzae TaxID=360412 RepID=UPI0038B35FEC